MNAVIVADKLAEAVRVLDQAARWADGSGDQQVAELSAMSQATSRISG